MQLYVLYTTEVYAVNSMKHRILDRWYDALNVLIVVEVLFDLRKELTKNMIRVLQYGRANIPISTVTQNIDRRPVLERRPPI